VKLLTKKKQRWVDRFKPTAAIRGSSLHSNHVAERRYGRQIKRMVDQMAKETEKEVKKLFTPEAYAEATGTDDSLSSQARILINSLARKYEKLFRDKARYYSGLMIKEQDKVSRSNLHSSLKEMSGGLSIKTNIMSPEINEVIKASVAENVSLIKSIPEQYIKRVEGSVMRSITSPTKGGLQSLFKDLKKYQGMSDRRALNIAKDQTRKVYNGINRARMEKIGITKAEWIHSGGSNHPRHTHVEMDGKIFNLSEGVYDSEVKKYVQPGELPYCGCVYRPVIEFEDGEEV